jgi:hypothetical protein
MNGDICPFCHEKIQLHEVIDTYRRYFDEEYEKMKARLISEIKKILEFNMPLEIEKIKAKIIGFPDFTDNNPVRVVTEDDTIVDVALHQIKLVLKPLEHLDKKRLKTKIHEGT